MTSVREEAISSLFSTLVSGLSSLTDSVYRNKEEALEIPDQGLVVLRDGLSGEPEDVLLSPQRFIYNHLAELTVIVRDKDEEDRDSALDALLVLVDESIVVDRTLGGKVEWCESQSPDVFSVEEDGQLFKYAIISILLRFTTTNALT